MQDAPTPRTYAVLGERFGARYKWYVSATVILGTFSVVLAATIINVAVQSGASACARLPFTLSSNALAPPVTCFREF